jgi:hypothetical protein
MMLLAAVAASLAIVAQDQVPLRNAPRDSAQQQAVLSQGDTVELRGERMDYLQVYDHRRERAGYVRASLLRPVSLQAEDAPALLVVLRFLREQRGAESLGIAYAAAYLKAAPAAAIDAEAFAALGEMADRLAAQASARQGTAEGSRLGAQLETAATYGVGWTSFERDGAVQLCYDGEALRRVMALPASAEQRARAALALTRPECVDPATPPLQRHALDDWRAEVLERVDTTNLPPALKNRIHMRRAGVWSSLAFERARGEAASEAAERALQELATVDKAELADADRSAYSEAAVRVGASRWAAAAAARPAAGLAVTAVPGEPGQTCVLLIDSSHPPERPLLSRCTFGTVFSASASVNANGSALALAVQPLESWRELWVFRRGAAGWEAQVLPPADDGPDIGYAEFAGWVPGGKRMLVAREARVKGRWTRSFELLRLDTLVAERHADEPASLGAFRRWQSPAWRAQTVALR